MNVPDQALLLRVYDTVADNSLWENVLSRIAHDVNAKGCIIFEWDDPLSDDRALQVPYHSDFFEREIIDGYLARCSDAEGEDQDLFEAQSKRSDDIDLIDDLSIAPSLAALKAKRNVELLQKFGIFHRAAGLLNKDNTARGRFSVQLGSDRGPLTPDEHRYLAQVLPHVAKALELGHPLQRLTNAKEGLLAVMNALSTGVCLLDADGRVVATNQEFERQKQDYGHLRVTREGKLDMTTSSAEDWFQRLMADTRHHGKFGARPRKEAVETGQGGYLCLELTPLTQLDEAGTTPIKGFILHSVDASRPISYDAALVTQAFGLTQTEHQLTDGITQGLTNAQIAEQRGRAIQTVNAQVKSILSKTDCSNRTQLVRCLMGFDLSRASNHAS